MPLRKFLSHEHPLRFAHRGSMILWPENTMAAFQGAVDHGCIYIETDLHATKDGVLVLFHDDSLERTTDGQGKVEDWYWNDLRRLDAAFNFKPGEGYPFRNKGVAIPSLEEVLKTFPQVLLNLDLKQDGIEHLAADFITGHGYEERVLIASFKDRRVRTCRRLLENRTASSAGTHEAILSWAYSRIGKRYHIKADVLQVPVRRAGMTIVDEKFLKTAHAQGLQVHAWTIDEPQQMRQLIELGVDGIITNRIDILNRVLAV